MKSRIAKILWMGMLLAGTRAFSQDPDFYVFLCFGQSNMEGNARIEEQDRSVDDRFQVLQAVDCPDPGKTKGTWRPAVPPLCRCTTGIGPADYFGRTMVANLPGNIRVGIINVSVGGCKIELFDKDHYQSYIPTVPSWMMNMIKEYNGNPYARLVEMAKLAQKDGVIKGILLHQGESNTNDSTWTNQVKRIYDNLVTDLHLDPGTTPLLAGEVVHSDQGGICAAMNRIIAQLPQVIANSHVISSSGCSDAPDNLHFNTAGYKRLGSRYAEKMLSLIGYEPGTPKGVKVEEGVLQGTTEDGLTVYRGVPFAVAAPAGSYQKTELGIKSTINSVTVEIQVYNPSTIRVLKSPAGIAFEKKSLSVIATPQKTEFGIHQLGDELVLNTQKVKLGLNLKNGRISFATLTGKPLLTEKEAGTAFIEFDDAGNKTFSVSQAFVLAIDEAIYGLGQQQNGKMVQRDIKLYMVQNNTEDFIPFFQSTRGYGLFWDNYSPTLFEDDPHSTSFTSDVGDGVDYYFMYGGNADGVIACMRSLTGQAPMMPLWTFGYWQSKERYKSQDELLGVVEKYRELGVPLDGIIQDWQYWGNNYLWNAMEFLNPEFSNPQKMVDDVHKLNAHIIISIWSSFGPQTKPYKELDNIGALLDIKTWPESGSEKWPPIMDYPSGVRVYDPFNPQARDIYWKYLHQGIFSLGMDGWWMDSTEPDHMQFKPSDFDNKTCLGSFRKVRNAFPLMTVGGVFQHQRSTSSDKRVFILTRSAFAGQQRYSANTWSGDVVASWQALRNQISAGLNFSLCGIPYWNSDIGGFFLWNFPKTLNDANYRELYVRWLQFGTLCPMMRAHGTDAPREIYQFGKKGDKIYDTIAAAIDLRYALLPYIYSTSWEVTAHQSSMMRALMMDFADDKNALDINDQYLFGSSLMACPVTEPLYVDQQIAGPDTTWVENFSRIKSKTIYLPGGTDWYDFWSGEKYTGGQTINQPAPIQVMPILVKAGSILPLGPKVQYATEKKWDALEIRIYPGADGRFILYEDENDNYNYENGSYATIAFKWDDRKKTLTIDRRQGSFPGMLSERMFHIVKVAAGAGAGLDATVRYDRSVSYKGDKVVVRF